MSLSRITRYAAGLSLASCLLNGCSLMPRSIYEQPRIPIPQKWEGQGVTGEAIANREQWWKNFNDPILDELIDLALRTNNDLAAATIKVRRAQLKSGLTDTNMTPSVSISAESSFDRDLNQATVSESHGVIGTLSYELDLWGRLARLRDVDRWEAEATDVDRQNTALSLIATTASAYWRIAYLNQRIALGEASIGYAEKALELVQVKYRAGAVSRLDWVQAQQNVATQKANLIQLLQQRTEARNALAILFDQAPQNRVPERSQLPDGPLPAIAADLPASLLGRRPDLHAAELRLREYLANIDATQASFYPTFSLTGSLNTSSTSLVSMLQNPAASLGVGLALPFVQWNTATLTVKVSETQYEEAVVNFRQTLYQALSDVENTLSANTRYREESFRLELALDWSRQAERLVEIRYRAGATGMQSWLDAQETRRTAETAVAVNHLNQLTNLMKLYQALGG
ncbi:MAG: efflux transporter outer membrane subunit [Deltaproteobacteria bacterium]|nr:efflux transporter outer membrane subunit [Deltaproteobacteria bacterium]